MFQVNGVRAQWKEPIVQAADRSQAELYTWIGLGGWGPTFSNIIQAGTYEYFPPTGGENTGFWYELVPAKPIYVPVPLHTGDALYVEITETQTNHWHIYGIDAAHPQSPMNVSVTYNSSLGYPSFVAEAPDLPSAPLGDQGPFSPLPKWSALAMHQIAVRSNGTWLAGASLYAYRITMIQNGRTIATAGPLDATSSFTLAKL